MRADDKDALSIDDAITDVEVYSDKTRYHEPFSRLRRAEPVRWTTPRNYRPFWTVSKHADISEVQRQLAVFLNGPRTSPAGDSLLMCYPSACRDEDVFEDPFSFRVDRESNPHLAFGIGPHVCLGQYLARVEMTTFYTEILARVTDIELNGEPVGSLTLFMGGLKRLPIRYSMTNP